MVWLIIALVVMNSLTEETVPAYSNLGLTTASIHNYKVGHVSWAPGESPADNLENCDTPFAFFQSHFVNHSMEDKLPTLYVRLKGNHNSLITEVTLVLSY